MIPDIVGIFFLAIPLLCLAYIFRGTGEDYNPLWGNVVASALGGVVSAMIAIWFVVGTVVTPIVVQDATFHIDPINTSSISTLLDNASVPVTVLGRGGAGMFEIADISRTQFDTVNASASVDVSTGSIVYLQYQDFGVMFLYGALVVVFLALFLWSISELRKESKAQKEEEEAAPGE